MMRAMTDVSGCRLAWSMTDLTPPWVADPPVVVMHHGIGSSSHIFDGWIPALALTHRILRFDMRGHGASARPDATPIDMDRLSDDLLAVMDAASVHRAHLVGESIGATIALHTALRAPERAISLTFSNGAHVGASIESIAGWRRMIEDDGMMAWSDFMMQGRFAPDAIAPDAWRWFRDQQATACPATVLRMLQALVGADLLGGLAGLRPRLLILHPDRSPFVPVAVAADLAARVPNSRLHVIGGARHGLPFSHAGICAALALDFVRAPCG